MSHLARKNEAQKRLIWQALQIIGLSAAIAVLLIRSVSCTSSQSLHTSPQGLYQTVYHELPLYLYEPDKLSGDWSSWADGCPRLESDNDAVTCSNKMLATLADPYTRLYSAREAANLMQETSGKSVGIGILIDPQMDATGEKPALAPDQSPKPKTDPDEYPLIGRVFESGPADKAGLKVGDAIVSADGTDLKGASLQVLLQKLKDKSGTTVNLVIRRNGINKPLTVTRDVFNRPAVSAKRFGSIGYIHLESFQQDDTVEEIKEKIRSLDDTKSLILDLRNNPGGQVDITVKLASLFLQEGTIVSIHQRVPKASFIKKTYSLSSTNLVTEEIDETTGRSTRLTQDRLPNMTGDKPIVILVNGQSASAAEMFTGALKDNGRAIIVGERTFGKGIGQALLPFPNGTILSVTMIRYFTPNGTWPGDGSANLRGIAPHHHVRQGAKILSPGSDTDEQLKFAIELLENGKN